MDKFIYPLRKQFPLVADALASTQTGPDVPIEAIEARNVLDGKKLVDQITKSKITAYPWGVADLPPAAPDEQTALNGVANTLLNSYDAIADLALAEGVYQAVQGNYDRVASTIAAYTTGNFPPEPGIVDTSPPGIGLTHRFAIQFRPGLVAPAGATPRAQAEPAIDDWLIDMLPPLRSHCLHGDWNDPITAAAQQHTVTLADLGLRPIDALYLLKPDNVQAMAEIDDRIQRYVLSTWSPRPDASIQIQYMTALAGQFSVFESGPLLRNLRSLLTQSRPLRASDVLRANDATPAGQLHRLPGPESHHDSSGGSHHARRRHRQLRQHHACSAVARHHSEPCSDHHAGRFIHCTGRGTCSSAPQVSRFLPRVGVLSMHGCTRLSPTCSRKSRALVARWAQKLTDFNNALTAYDALPAGYQRRRSLCRAAGGGADGQRRTRSAACNSRAHACRPACQGNRLAEPPRAISGNFKSARAAPSPHSSPRPLHSRPPSLIPSHSTFPAIGDRAITITQDISRALTSQSAVAKARMATVNADLAQAASATSARRSGNGTYRRSQSASGR